MKGLLSFLTLFIILWFNILLSVCQTGSYSGETDNYVKLINESFRQQNWDGGKKLIDKALKEDPADVEVRTLLGKYYYEQRLYDQARYELLGVLDLNRSYVGAKQILVNVEMDSKRYSSAICYINELLEVNPYWKGLWMKKIQAYRIQGNREEANRLLKRLSQIYPEDTEIREAYLYNIEEELVEKKNRGELNQAIALSEDLIEKDPHNDVVFTELVNNCLKAGNYEKALIYTERGLYHNPSSLLLINKKADILGEQQRYSEVISFLHQKIQEGGGNRPELSRRYNAFLAEAARNSRMNDPYTLYSMLLERNPNDNEAFNQVVNLAMEKGLHDEALQIIRSGKRLRGETKTILLKERSVYNGMKLQSKADQVTVRLYNLYPEDSDIEYDYTLYRHRFAQSCMNDALHEKALEHWEFILDKTTDEDLKKSALSSIFTCNHQLGKVDQAHAVLDTIMLVYPHETEWFAKRAMLYGAQRKYFEALQEYEKLLDRTEPVNRERALIGYDELAIGFVKTLTELHRVEDAMKMTNRWLELNPQSEMGIYYAVNLSAHKKDFDTMERYALLGISSGENTAHYKSKLTEVYNARKEFDTSFNLLSDELSQNPYHKELVAAYSQTGEDYARSLIKDTKYDESLEVLNQSLMYDPDNKSLKYWKGVAYEKLHQNDSAYYYQSFYEPSLVEMKDFSRHLKYLKYNNHKNEVSFYYLRSRFNDKDVISYISTVEYSRFEKNNTYVGRINYTGRQPGKGVQGHVEWSRIWKPGLQSRIDVAASNKFFSKVMVNGSVYKGFRKSWEAELGAGYRRMDTDKNMFNVVAGIAKELDPCWLNMRFNSIVMDGSWYYSLLAQGRFYLQSPKTYIQAMASIGSAPDVDVIDNQLYNGFSVTNSMVGLGLNHLINDVFSVGVTGNWYNYKDVTYKFEEGDGKYRNMYNIYFQFHVRF